MTEGSIQTVNFTFPKAYDRDVIVQWVVSGTGAASDLVLLSGSTTVLQGNLSGSFNIATNDNAIYDLSREYQLSVNVVDPASEVISKIFRVDDNESIPVVEFSAPTQNVAENALLPVMGFTVSPASKFAITVNVSVAGTASGSGVDHSMLGGNVTIPALSTTHDVPLSLVDDILYEPIETINLNLMWASNATGSANLGAGTNHIASIVDDENSYVSISDLSVNEAGIATFTVSVSGTPVVPITFDWATANGTGTSAADYFTTSGTAVTITPPATSTTITVNTRDDATTCETDKTFIVMLSNIAGAGVGDPSAVATITDPDVPALSFNAAASAVTEGNTATIPVSLAQSCATHDISFTATTANGTAISAGGTADYTPLVAVAGTIPSGSTSTNVTVTSLSDIRDENNETLTVALAGTTLGAQGTHTLTINDDDVSPTISIAPTITYAEGSGAGTANVVYTVTASAASDLNITVDYATSLASSGYIAATPADFTTTTGTATITAGSLTTTINIPVVRDTMDEFDEDFNFTLSGGANYTVAGSVLASVVTITDDDLPPTISIDNPIEFSEGVFGMSVNVTLSQASGKVITFDLNTSDGTAIDGADYNALSINNATIAPGATSSVFLFGAIDDAVNCELTETLTFTLSDLQNATAGTLVGNAIILENDIPILSVTSEDLAEGAAASLIPTISLACPANVSFDWQTIANSATPGDDFTSASGTVTFLAGMTTTAQTIDVQTTDDSILEVEEKLYVATFNSGPIQSTAPGLITIADNEGGVGVVKVSVGDRYACALSSLGDVKCWGKKVGGVIGQKWSHIGDEAGEMGNSLAQLSLGDNSGTPYQVTKIVRGAAHSCAILNNGRLKCWGMSAVTNWLGDHYGENGNGLPFVDLGTDGFGNPLQVVDVAVMNNANCALFSNQRMKCWGYIVRIHGRNEIVGDSPAEMGDALPYMDLGGTNQVLKMSGGLQHICVILDDLIGAPNDGDVKCWGDNSNGVLGNNSVTPTPNDPAAFGNALPIVDLGTGVKATDIIAGGSLTCALVDTNVVGSLVKCWGLNSTGQLGIGSTETIGNGYVDAIPLVPVDEMGDNLDYVPLGGRVTNLFASHSNVCAILDDNGNKNDGGDLKCWGWNHYAQTGNGVSYTNVGDNAGEIAALSNVNLGTGLKAYDVSMHGASTCVLTQSGVKCFGNRFRGQLGNPFTADADGIVGNSAGEMGNALSFVDVGAVTVTGLTKGAVSGGGIADAANHCAIIQGGTVKCWGDNRNQQLLQVDSYIGDGPGEMGASLPLVNLGTGVKAKDIAAGGAVTCVLTTDDRVKCWGAGIYLGIGAGHWDERGDEPNEMGDNLPYLDFGPGRTVQHISTGDGHGCAILDNFTTKCWGWSGQGDQVGPGGRNTFGPMTAEPVMDFGRDRYAIMMSGRDFRNGCALLDNLKIKCWGYNESGQLFMNPATNPFYGNTLAQDGDDLPYMDLGTNLKFISVEARNSSMCALTHDGKLKCWGGHYGGILGTGEAYNQTIGWVLGDVPAERGDGLPFVRLNNETVYQYSHGSCVITGINRELKCFGEGAMNGRGLGIWGIWGDVPGEVDAGMTPLPIGVGRKAVSVSIKTAMGCVLLDDGTVKCWGLNDYGQLGKGDTYNVGDDPGEFAAIVPLDLGF